MSLTAETQHLLETLKTAVVTVNSGFDITYANHAAQTLLQLSLNQLVTRKLPELFVEGGLDVDRIRQAFERAEDVSESEVQLALVDGRFILADLSYGLIEMAEGSELLFEVKQIDQQKRISQESQQWAQQQAARHLIRGLAHEIKNPLGGIRGAAQLLEKELVNPEQKEYTRMIIEQSDRLRTLVDRLLGPNTLPAFAWTNVHKAVENIRQLVTADTSHQVTISRDYDPSIPDLFIDKDMIEQAVLNVVRNSIQAMQQAGTPHPHISIVTRVQRQITIHGARYPLAAQIKIIDNGPGVPAELKDTLFYPMVTGTKGGTGLGLSIAQTLLDHHKGKVDVESWPGHTEFSLYIPIEKKDP